MKLDWTTKDCKSVSDPIFSSLPSKLAVALLCLFTVGELFKPLNLLENLCDKNNRAQKIANPFLMLSLPS